MVNMVGLLVASGVGEDPQTVTDSSDTIEPSPPTTRPGRPARAKMAGASMTGHVDEGLEGDMAEGADGL